ncbi:LytR C-terminal domain-containing protein [Arcanobacterium hippocoleae]|uniref:LytR/CpsA/Psr regulator C-terminal domain-containing protein n=1 Tax=Arcanobacterium hippocoleae TaxID=149017 RepID=A0ABU1T369_9ACTO|nr:LytR C-terminal domain-containing protein [Arcanobacterium hippocoleae]MDR6939809.1 hypothetical protein [Arcanobacterium hippocoleae]
MVEIKNQYALDEFDELAAKRQTYGAHRGYRRKYGWVIALAAILVLAPIAGVLAGEWLSSTGAAKEAALKVQEKKAEDDSASEKGAAEESQVAGSDTPDKAADPKAAAGANGENHDPSAEVKPPAPEPKPEIKFATSVSVLNASGIQGLAREKSQLLRNAGFTKLVVDNYRGRRIAQSTVYYSDAALADTAKKVAADLGIVNIAQNAQIARAGSITAILASR